MATKVKVTHSTVGPAHDPYSRVTFEAQVGPKHCRLVCCGLAGNSLEVNGVLISNRYHGEQSHDKPIDEFERLVGRSLDDIEEEEANTWADDSMGHPSKYI